MAVPGSVLPCNAGPVEAGHSYLAPRAKVLAGTVHTQGSMEEYGVNGYLYEPERSKYQDLLSSSSSSSSSDSEGDNLALLSLEGRAKQQASTWCKCGHCTVQKTDAECYCCKEHELLIDRMDGQTCFTMTDNQYVVQAFTRDGFH